MSVPQLWDPRDVSNPELGDWSTYDLAAWPTSEPHAPYVKAEDLRELVVIDTSRFDGPHHPKCRTFADFGRTGKSLKGGAHPCGKRDCRECACQWSVHLLGHFYASWSAREGVWVHSIPGKSPGTLQRALARLSDDEQLIAGNYFRLNRHADNLVHVFATCRLGGQWAQYGRWLDVPDALGFARDVALRQPFEAEPNRPSYSSSGGWALPDGPKRDRTYARGIPDDTVAKFKADTRKAALDQFGAHLETLPVETIDSLAEEVCAEGLDGW